MIPSSPSVAPARHRLADYAPLADTGVLIAPGTVPDFAYADGAEGRLLQQFQQARDLSTGSPELAALIRDWPTMYHLTPLRTTLFDAFGMRGSSARVLELGAGIGAITRWLGENCAEVHAVEGSLARARAARARTADLENVTVYSGNYSELDEQGTFDVVTLIGVLEYSHMYHPTIKDPELAALDNLRVARRALRPDGVLFLAIENRLGLKYWAGAREDHSGRRYESVHGHPDHGVPVTWSRRDLERLVREAGFDTSELYLPYPDYKLPTTLVNDARATDADHVHNWIRTPAPDRSAPRHPLPFNETLATREAVRAGLGGDMANSHLLLAFAGDRDATAERLGMDTDWVARHWSTSRRPGFSKRVTLRRDDAGARIVNDRPGWLGAAAEAEAAEVSRATGVTQHLVDEAFEAGDLLAYEVIGDVSRHGLGDRFLAHLRRFSDWLDEHYGVEGRPGFVRGEAFDVVWWNVVVGDGGEWRVIDREWEVGAAIPRDYVLWRMLITFINRHRLELPGAAKLGAPEFAAGWLAKLGRGVDGFAEIEKELQEIVNGRGIPAKPFAPVRDAAPAAEQADATPFVVCFAEDADAAALKTWATAVRPGEASLIVYAPGADESALVESFTAAVAEARVDLDAHELIALPLPPGAASDDAVLRQASAVLAPTAVRAPFAGLPRFAPGQDDALRRFVLGQEPAPEPARAAPITFSKPAPEPARPAPITFTQPAPERVHRFVVALDPEAPATSAVVRAYCSAFKPGEPVELALAVAGEPTERDGAAVTALLQSVAPNPAALPDVVVYGYDEVRGLEHDAALIARAGDPFASVEATSVVSAITAARGALDGTAAAKPARPGSALAAGLRRRG